MIQFGLFLHISIRSATLSIADKQVPDSTQTYKDNLSNRQKHLIFSNWEVSLILLHVPGFACLRDELTLVGVSKEPAVGVFVMSLYWPTVVSVQRTNSSSFSTNLLPFISDMH